MHQLIVLVSALFCAFFGAYLWVMDLGMSRQLTVLTVVPTLMMAAVVSHLPRKATFSPLFLLYLMVLFANSVRYFVLSLNTDYLNERYYLDRLTLEEYTSGALIYLIGVLALVAGYVLDDAIRAGHNRARRRAAPPRDAAAPAAHRLSLNAFLIVCVVFIAVLAPYLNSTGFLDDMSSKRVLVDDDGVTYRFGAARFVLAILTISFQIMLAYAVLTDLRKHALVGGLSLAAIVFLAFALSKRSLLMASLLPVVLIYLQRFDFRSQMRTGVIGALMLAVAAVVTIERKNTDNSPAGAYLESAATAGREVFLSANFSGLVATAMSTVTLEDSLPPYYGSTYLLDPVSQFVPRSLWADKPEELGGRLREHHQDIGFTPRGVNVGGVAPGAIGEAWLNFRMPGVVGVMLLYGVLLSRMFRAYLTGPRASTLQQAAYLCYLPNVTLFYFGGHFARAVIMSVSFLLGYLVVRLVLRPARGTRVAAPRRRQLAVASRPRLTPTGQAA